jgi:hypothetical protein
MCDAHEETRHLQKRAWANRSSRLRMAVDQKFYGQWRMSPKVNLGMGRERKCFFY